MEKHEENTVQLTVHGQEERMIWHGGNETQVRHTGVTTGTQSFTV